MNFLPEQKVAFKLLCLQFQYSQPIQYRQDYICHLEVTGTGTSRTQNCPDIVWAALLYTMDLYLYDNTQAFITTWLRARSAESLCLSLVSIVSILSIRSRSERT